MPESAIHQCPQCGCWLRPQDQKCSQCGFVIGTFMLDLYAHTERRLSVSRLLLPLSVAAVIGLATIMLIGSVGAVFNSPDPASFSARSETDPNHTLEVQYTYQRISNGHLDSVRGIVTNRSTRPVRGWTGAIVLRDVRDRAIGECRVVFDRVIEPDETASFWAVRQRPRNAPVVQRTSVRVDSIAWQAPSEGPTVTPASDIQTGQVR